MHAIKVSVVASATLFALWQNAALAVVVDPDAFPDGTILDNAFPGVRLSAVGTEYGLDGHVYAQAYTFNSTSPNVFGNTAWSSGWIGDSSDSSPAWLRADFLTAVTEVTIDAVGNDTYDRAEIRA